ncbi:unnamed protein product [Camellia sinensis]
MASSIAQSPPYPCAANRFSVLPSTRCFSQMGRRQDLVIGRARIGWCGPYTTAALLTGQGISASGRLFPQISSTSERTRACHSGYAANNIKHHDADTAVVSWPAKYIFLQLSTMNLLGVIPGGRSPLSLQFLAASSIVSITKSYITVWAIEAETMNPASIAWFFVFAPSPSI